MNQDMLKRALVTVQHNEEALQTSIFDNNVWQFVNGTLAYVAIKCYYAAVAVEISGMVLLKVVAANAWSIKEHEGQYSSLAGTSKQRTMAM